MHHAAVAPEPLGGVERAVGRAPELGRVARLGPAPGHADRHRHGAGEAVELAPHERPDLLGQRQRARLRRARQHERELLAPEPRGHVGLAGRRAQEGGEAPQHVVAGVVAQRVVDALEVVEVDDEQREVAAGAGVGEVALDRQLEAAAVAQAGERVVRGEVLEALEPARGLDRPHRLVGEHAQRLQRLVGGQQPVLRVVDPHHPVEPAGRVVQRHDEPVVVPGERPAPVGDRRVHAAEVGRALDRHVALHDDAAVAHERGVEQRLERRDRHERELRGLLGREADARQRHELARPRRGRRPPSGSRAPRAMPQQTASSISSAVRAPVSWADTAQQVLDRGAVAAPELGASAPARPRRRVRGDGAEQLELDRRRAAAGDRLVDGHDPEQRADAGPQRHHQRVVGMPGVGRRRTISMLRRVDLHAAPGPVVLAGGDEVGAVAEEARR